jgi:hypothetical protein
MNKPFNHNNSLFKYGWLALFVIMAGNIHAQEKEDTIILLDTLIDAPPAIASEDTVIHFDRVIYTPKVRLRSVPDSQVQILKKDDDFWYANILPAKKKQAKARDKQPDGLPFYRQPWFKTMLWIIIIGAFAAVVVWYLAVSNVRLFRKASPGIINAGNEDEHNDIFSINYDTEISKALNTKNHRLAIRLLYLQTLKILAEKGIIQYKAERTNSDYLWQLHGSTYYQDFFRLTRDFDYTWYGKFDVPDATFQTIHNDFITFKNRLQ